jgi:hypothetical protein
MADDNNARDGEPFEEEEVDETVSTDNTAIFECSQP